MSMIMNWLSGVVDRAVTAVEDRLDQAMTCPECGHGAESDPVIREEQAAGCGCTDDYCACNPDALADPTYYGGSDA